MAPRTQPIQIRPQAGRVEMLVQTEEGFMRLRVSPKDALLIATDLIASANYAGAAYQPSRSEAGDE